jgi:hypothetical protein
MFTLRTDVILSSNWSLSKIFRRDVLFIVTLSLTELRVQFTCLSFSYHLVPQSTINWKSNVLFIKRLSIKLRRNFVTQKFRLYWYFSPNTVKPVSKENLGITETCLLQKKNYCFKNFESRGSKSQVHVLNGTSLQRKIFLSFDIPL